MTKIPVLFELMEQRGITAKKLSDDTKISTGNISDWKSGRAKPSFEKIKLLAEYFGVTTDYLLTGKENPPANVQEENKKYGRLTILARHLEEIPDEDREQLIDTLESTIDIYLKAKGLK